MKLVVLKHNQQINSVDLDVSELNEEFFVGRAEDCHVRLNDPLLSRHHFLFKVTNKQWSIEKLTHLGDLSINGQETISGEIKNADRISFGSYTLIPQIIDPKIDYPKEASYSPDKSLISSTDGVTDYDITTHQPVTDISETIVQPMQPVQEIEENIMDLSNPLALDMGEETPKEREDKTVIKEEFSLQKSDDAPESLSDGPSDMMDFNNEEQVIGKEITESKTEESFQSNESQSFPTTTEGGFQDNVPQDNTALEDNSDKTKVFNSFARFEIQLFGEYAPYDRYLIEDTDIFIGRDNKKCQICLNDPEVSSVHAVIRKQGSTIYIEDLNSSNGTLLKGERVNKSEIRNGDEFVIGSTTFTVKVQSELLENESDRLMPVDLYQVVEKEEVVEEEVDLGAGGVSGDAFQGDAPLEKSLIKRIMKDPKKRMMAIVGGLALFLLLSYEDESATTPKPDENKTAEAKPKEPEKKPEENKKQLTDDEKRNLEGKYKFAESLVAQGKLDDALVELEQIMQIDDTFNNVKTLYGYVKQKNDELKRKEEERAELARREKLKEEVKALEAEAEKAVKDRNIKYAEEIFAQISQKDPENIRVQTLKIELEGWLAEEARKASELARKESERKRQVDALTPGKGLYLKKEWFRAIAELEKFLQEKGMDEDLVKDASDMLGDAKNNLGAELAPILGKARSFKEGQDLKSAYETYQEILKIDPFNSEATYEMDNIRETLDLRSKKIYREGIISESLSLFNDAKEKFLEVQQNSPSDSEYYKKATEKLKNYLE